MTEEHKEELLLLSVLEGSTSIWQIRFFKSNLGTFHHGRTLFQACL